MKGGRVYTASAAMFACFSTAIASRHCTSVGDSVPAERACNPQGQTEVGMANVRPLALWVIERGEAASSEGEGASNSTYQTGSWRYGSCVSVSSGEAVAKHNLPFRPSTQALPSEQPLHQASPLKSPEQRLSGGVSQEIRLENSVEEVSVKMCLPETPEELNSQKRKTLGVPKYLLSNGKRSTIKPFAPPRQVAVSGAATPARPASSLQEMVPASSNQQNATEFKHPAGVPSWDAGQRATSAVGEAVQHSPFGPYFNMKASSSPTEASSSFALRYPSTASSTRLCYPHVPSSSAGCYPQVSSPSTVWYPQLQNSSTGYPRARNSSTVRYPQPNSSSQGQHSQQTLHVQHSRTNDSSFETIWTDWRSVPATEQFVFQTAAGRPVRVSASAMARAHALLGEDSGGDM